MNSYSAPPPAASERLAAVPCTAPAVRRYTHCVLCEGGQRQHVDAGVVVARKEVGRAGSPPAEEGREGAGGLSVGQAGRKDVPGAHLQRKGGGRDGGADG